MNSISVTPLFCVQSPGDRVSLDRVRSSNFKIGAPQTAIAVAALQGFSCPNLLFTRCASSQLLHSPASILAKDVVSLSS